MVCIASDVDPIELVVWLPALCKKMEARSRRGTKPSIVEEWFLIVVIAPSTRVEARPSLDARRGLLPRCPTAS